MAILNLSGKTGGDEANDETNDESEANIKKEIGRFKIRAIGKATLLPEQEREPHTANIIGAVSKAEYSGKAAVGLEMSGEEVGGNK